MVIGAQVNGHLAGRFGPSALLTNGLITMVGGGTVLVTIVVTGAVGLVGVIPALFVVMYGFGFVGPNAVALALQRYPEAAGTASAILGSFQFVLAALVAPLAGIGGTSDALPMAVLILVLPMAALGTRILVAGSGSRQPAPVVVPVP
jgi:MFS transporter, DHA1 family, multidrug resistance protein